MDPLVQIKNTGLPPLHDFVPSFVTKVKLTQPDNTKTDDELRETAVEMWKHLRELEVFSNGEYAVEIDKKPRHGFEGMILWKLRIYRHDMRRLKHWSVIQEIKRALCGDDVDAVLVFPGDVLENPPENMVDLWAFMELKAKPNKDGSPRRPLLQFGFRVSR